MMDAHWVDYVDRAIEECRPKPENPIPLRVRHEIASFLQACGRPPKYSTDIGGELTSGYGRLDSMGFWEYPL